MKIRRIKIKGENVGFPREEVFESSLLKSCPKTSHHSSKPKETQSTPLIAPKKRPKRRTKKRSSHIPSIKLQSSQHIIAGSRLLKYQSIIHQALENFYSLLYRIVYVIVIVTLKEKKEENLRSRGIANPTLDTFVVVAFQFCDTIGIDDGIVTNTLLYLGQYSFSNSDK